MQQIYMPKKPFPLDRELLLADLQAISAKFQNVMFDSSRVAMVIESPLLEEESRTLKAFWGEIDPAPHAAKLLLPSRKPADELKSYVDEKKPALLAKDWSALSLTEKKVLFGLPLSNDEIDAL